MFEMNYKDIALCNFHLYKIVIFECVCLSPCMSVPSYIHHFCIYVAELLLSKGNHTFNTISIKYLTRYRAKAEMTIGQGSSWFIESPSFVHLCVNRPPKICVNLVLKHIHAASIYTVYIYIYIYI